MELDELKSAWNKFASNEESKRTLSIQEVGKMLTTQTRDITQKIGRNIRIGVGIILVWVLFGIIVNIVVSPLLKNVLDKPYMTEKLLNWSYFTDICSYVLIFITILIFWIRYSKIEKQIIDDSNLRNTLVRLIGIVTSYKKMFYIVLVILLFYVTVAFSSGFFLETSYQIKESGLNLASLSFKGWLMIITAFSLALGAFLVVFFLLFNFFFKRLYGRYLKKMIETLKELDEVNS